MNRPSLPAPPPSAWHAVALLGAALHFTFPSVAMSHACQGGSAEASRPRTVAEASEWKRTSTHADVLRFLAELDELPHADRLRRHEGGKSEEGRELPLVIAASPMPEDDRALLASSRLRVLVNANIHAGEVEGKAAVQMILREIASGQHAELLEQLIVFFVPIYNADGNDRIDARNRVGQNGPDGGVGTRPNAQGLDLNRDFVKVEAAETRTLMGWFRRYDPQVFMDLHTTDGSYHGYHLTYSPSLSTNVDEELDAFNRGTLLAEIRASMLSRHGLRVFDYGNFNGGDPRRWVTYDHRPRFGTNYYGLRNRLSVLSEAYSHLDFEQRVRVTHAFVLETLRSAARHAQEIAALCTAADQRAQAGDPDIRFGWDSALAPPVEGEILVGDVERVELPDGRGTRIVAKVDHRAERMPIQVVFAAARRLPLPAAWVLPEPTPEVVENLGRHGLELLRLVSAVRVEAQSFTPTELRKAHKPFQGHEEIELAGTWNTAFRELPPGALVIPARQKLARVAAQLLEPLSEDSLSTWNLFENATRVEQDEHPGRYPVLRLMTLDRLDTEPLPSRSSR